MNQRGFTVIELLVSLTIIGVIMSLLIGSMVSTRKFTRESELRADAFTSVTRSMDVLRNSIQTMIPNQETRLDFDSLKFNYRKSGEIQTLQVEKQDDGFKIHDSGRSVFLFPGNLSFRYLVGEVWLDQLEGNQLPFAVAVSAQYPGSSVDYELVINLLTAPKTPDLLLPNPALENAEAASEETTTTDEQEVQDVE